MFLHLIGNDPKFPKLIREKFEKAEAGSHVYIIVKTNPNQPENAGADFKYVSSAEELDVIVSARRDWEAIILNGLLSRLVSFLPVLPHLPLAYFLWGGEAYAGIFARPDALYGPQTAAAVLSLPKRMQVWFSLLVGVRARQRRECKKVAQRIDISVFPIEQEVQLFVERGLLPQSSIYMRGSVGRGIDIDDAIYSRGISSDNILIGNSADPSNNHLDSFCWLESQQVDLEGRKIIVPLSYGGNEEYKKKVLTAGRTAFGDAFYPLLDFMLYPEYIEIVRSCRFVIMNHQRQQAAGNVFMALAFGATVFLNEETTLASGLISRGFHMGCLNCQQGTDLSGFKAISLEQAEYNRVLVKEYSSKEISRLRIIALIDKLRELK